MTTSKRALPVPAPEQDIRPGDVPSGPGDRGARPSEAFELELRNVSQIYRGGSLAASPETRAVDDVSLGVRPGEVLAVVGESGSGKTTLTRLLLGLEQPTSGQVLFRGRPLDLRGRATERAFRREVQGIFQDPFSSLDPRWTVARSVSEAMVALRTRSRADRGSAVAELMGKVGLPEALADRKPRNLSGGQRQRVAIAAALAPNPSVLVADEPVTSLDVSIQAQILNLLHGLKTTNGLTMVFVSHDLTVVQHISDRVVVMRSGRVVETGTTHRLFEAPKHPYTQALLAASPALNSHALTTRELLSGDRRPS
ncbi:ATP-binding cassette domain-containing protein [Jiangella muralis]|uniref:ATP-binding cassette domain-containing protein n=1 Tax=Jiangella muralis TaxID=702383 RepID=UPI00069CC5DB|nr:ATP-binding cassette domain-containing protein [Jiangella muralis]